MAIAESAVGTIDPALRVSRRRFPKRDVTVMALFACFVVAIIVWSFFPPEATGLPVGAPLSPPSWAHWAGTDEIGRDLWSRILVGSRLSLQAAAVVIVLGVSIGALIGLVAGTAGKRVNSVLMRLTDVFLALPAQVLAIAIAGSLGRSYWILLISLVVVWWPAYARIVRGQVRALVNRPFIEAAQLSGVKRRVVLFKHLLPGTIRPVLVAASMDISGVILTMAGLSFLGLGAPEPAPDLGSMCANGLTYLLTDWWVPVLPGLMIFVLGYTGNIVGDAVRDFLKAREAR